MTTTELAPCELLAQALSAWQQSATDLETYRDKASRAQADEDAALTSEVFSEHEIATRMGRAQNLRTVYATRIAHKEKAMASQVAALEAAYQPAVGHFSHLINIELDQRQALVTKRVLEALGVDDASLAIHEKLALDQYAVALVEFASSIREIARLRPSSFYSGDPTGTTISNLASALLENLKIFNQLTIK
jgi:hypothetical protein